MQGKHRQSEFQLLVNFPMGKWPGPPDSPRWETSERASQWQWKGRGSFLLLPCWFLLRSWPSGPQLNHGGRGRRCRGYLLLKDGRLKTKIVQNQSVLSHTHPFLNLNSNLLNDAVDNYATPAVQICPLLRAAKHLHFTDKLSARTGLRNCPGHQKVNGWFCDEIKWE